MVYREFLTHTFQKKITKLLGKEREVNINQQNYIGCEIPNIQKIQKN